MPSRKSKKSPLRPRSPWKSARGCDERALEGLTQEFAQRLKPGDWVLLEGPMGAGKSTFARFLIRALGVERRAEGSPTFAIAHEYVTRSGTPVVHMDLYRMRSEAELEEAGVVAAFWERPGTIALCEWASMWPGLWADLEKAARDGKTAWLVELDFSSGETVRDVTIQSL